MEEERKAGREAGKNKRVKDEGKTEERGGGKKEGEEGGKISP